MNEQQVRDDERRKIVEFLQACSSEIRLSPAGYNSDFLDAIIERLNHPNWIKDTEGH
jgi:hypothetical protein